MQFPDLRDLHLRHFGLTEAVARSYAEAAAVCLSRHHRSPIEMSVVVHGSRDERLISWIRPTARERAAWANSNDATEAGAYGVALAAIESTLQVFAIARAETRTGCDYYVGQRDDDLEVAYRLEVSGIDRGGMDVLRDRVTRKRRQAREGLSGLPALVCVVAFEAATIIIEAVEP